MGLCNTCLVVFVPSFFAMGIIRFFGLVFFMSIIAFTSAGKESFDGENFIVEWKVMPASKEIEFNITAKTIGWVGLGITEIGTSMQKLDVIVGGVDNSGKPYLWVSKPS